MFGDHTYLSGRDALARPSISERRPGGRPAAGRPGHGKSRVLDIGSNDGTQLKHFQALGYDVLGVESSKTTARLANEAGVPTLNQFFNHEVAREHRPKVRRDQRRRSLLPSGRAALGHRRHPRMPRATTASSSSSSST